MSTELMDPAHSIPAIVEKTPVCAACKQEMCATCWQCHVADCLLVGKSVTSKSDLINMKHLMATTQKAKGYVAISGELNVPKPYRVITDEEDIEATIKAVSDKLPKIFVRPCPVRPRHGFVESRTIDATSPSGRTKEITQIFREARAADPEAELLIVPAIDATHNVILTPTRMAIGKGNDGATAGRKSTVYPLAGVQFKELPGSLVQRAGVDLTSEDPYVEVVLKDGHQNTFCSYAETPKTECVYFTQLRAGVRIPPTVGLDFVPDRMQVEKVLEASGDLLEWERQVKEEITPGTAVYHIGGTLISHYGVHCVYNNIPIFTSRIPEVGEMLIPTPRIERPSVESILKGLAIGVGEYIGLTTSKYEGGGPTEVLGYKMGLRCNQAVPLILVSSHNAAAMGGDNGVWLGISAALMMRLGMAASHGEARHKDASSQSRGYIYRLALNDFFGARETIGHAMWRFTELSWSSGYGGKKWAECTEAIMRLERAAKSLIETKSDEAVTELVTALHNAINQAHNGGWWLNKFVRQDVFDLACAQSMYTLSLAAPTILDITNLEVKDKDVQEVLEQWKSAPDPTAVSGLSVAGTEHDPSKMEDDDDDDGDCQCELCKPLFEDDDDDDDPPDEGTDEPEAVQKIKPTAPDKGKENANGFEVPSTAKITSAQARLTGAQKIHVQYKMDQVPGYQSFDVKLPSPLSTTQILQATDELATLYSWAGSGTKYFYLTPEYKGDGNWQFSHSQLGIEFTHHCGGGEGLYESKTEEAPIESPF